jgi:hypothetical protein
VARARQEAWADGDLSRVERESKVERLTTELHGRPGKAREGLYAELRVVRDGQPAPGTDLEGGQVRVGDPGRFVG